MKCLNCYFEYSPSLVYPICLLVVFIIIAENLHVCIMISHNFYVNIPIEIYE